MSLRCASLYTFSNVYPVPRLPYGAIRWKLVLYGAVWWNLVPYGGIRCHMVETGAVWCRTVKTGMLEMWVTIPTSLRCVGS